jgi:hypothetical protein
MVHNNFSAFGRSEKIDLLNVRKKEFKLSRICTIKALQAKLMFKNFQLEKYSAVTLDRLLIFCSYASVNLKEAVVLSTQWSTFLENCIYNDYPNDLKGIISVSNNIFLKTQAGLSITKKMHQGKHIDARGREREDHEIPNYFLLLLFINDYKSLLELFGVNEDQANMYQDLLLIDVEHVLSLLIDKYTFYEIHDFLETLFQLNDEGKNDSELETEENLIPFG